MKVFTLLALSAASLIAAPCLVNPADAVGNPAFGATVGTFIGLGINPVTTCIENGLWSAPSGFGLGVYQGGASGSGEGIDNSVLGSYGGTALSVAGAANSLDHAWVQNTAASGGLPGGIAGARPSAGIIWALGGEANQAAVFVFVDHGPVPGEVLENTAWLGNNPNGTDAEWTQAVLTHVYGAGWSPDPSISDGFVAVYSLPNPAQTFRYVSVTWGGPAAILRDGDNEIDAVGGLRNGSGVNSTTPEPATYALMGFGLAGLGLFRAYRRRK